MKFIIKIKDKPVFKLVSAFSFAIILLLLAVIIVNFAVVDSTEDNIYSHDAIPTMASRGDKYDYILVFGCGVKGDGSLTDMLRDRVKVGAELYFSGISDKIIMSGDRSGESYDEPIAMKKYAVELGVPQENIICDYEGYSTHESVDRFEELYGESSVILVSQKYHLNRALYIAHEQGVYKSVAVEADLDTYRKQKIYEIREILARFKDVIFLN